MFVWVGIEVNDAFEDLGKKAAAIEQSLGCKFSCHVLPMHISLKMSFEVNKEQFEEVSKTILQFFGTLKPLEVSGPRLENAGNIVWIRYDENKNLCKIKDDLNAILSEKHGVGMHEYDSDYLFHTTVFMFDEEEKNAAAFKQVADVALPKKVALNKFIIGTSPKGELGTYTVCNEVKLS